jgi:hypothetical protein
VLPEEEVEAIVMLAEEVEVAPINHKKTSMMIELHAPIVEESSMMLQHRGIFLIAKTK